MNIKLRAEAPFTMQFCSVSRLLKAGRRRTAWPHAAV